MKSILSASFRCRRLGLGFAGGLTVLLALTALTARTSGESPPPPALPPPAERTIVFSADIKPILEASCLSCHAHGQKKGGFQVDSRALLLQGGRSGPGAQPGRSAESLIVQLVAGADPERLMPAKGERLTPAQIGLMRAWIDQGMPWESGIQLGRGTRAPLAPRDVTLPAPSATATNPVDRLLLPYFAAHRFTPPAPVPDAAFARRVYLDVIGLLPTPGGLRAFLQDPAPDKRARLVERLLADHQRYAEHWMSFWNDALRNDYRGTGYIDGGRKQITPWLYAALASNLPFDRFVAQLVNPDEHSEGFTKGIVWRGVVNASQTPPMQTAQNLSQVFLGINLKCASCHDSFISDWKLADAYGLASLYADAPLELVRCDTPTGTLAERQFLFPELGPVSLSTNRLERLERLAELVTSPDNGRLTRTIVNRLWARLLGRGLIEPTDEMDQPAWSADLLDWLAVDLARHDYDLRRTLRLILTSSAYALPAVGLEEQTTGPFVFRGPVVRRLSAEQYRDALSALTGLWHDLPANKEIDFTVAPPDAPRPDVPAPPAARWIWLDAVAAQGVPPQTIYLRKTVRLAAPLPETAVALVSADNRFTLYVNGEDAGSGDDWHQVRLLDLKSKLRVGENVFAVAAVNGEVKEKDPSPNPAGFLFHAWLRDRPATAPRGPARVLDFVSDGSWLGTTHKHEGWQKPDFTPADWTAAVDLGDADLAPWRLAGRWRAAQSVAAQHGRVRAVFAHNDPLMTALGRPNREQVVTTRASAATTLQLLELTNGRTLAELLQRGADHLLAQTPAPTGRALVRRLYRHALGRPPAPPELRLGESVVGATPRAEGVADLLWALTLTPEFQLIQ